MESLNLNNESLRQILSNREFAQFLSENIPQNGISQQEITYLLNLFHNQEDNNNIRHSIAESINSSNYQTFILAGTIKSLLFARYFFGNLKHRDGIPHP